MAYRYSYVLNNPTRYTDPTGNAYNGGTWSFGAAATFAANYNDHTAEFAAWEQFFNAEKADMMRELMPQSGGGTSIAEVNMGEGYTAIWDNSSSAFVQNYYAFRAGLIRYRYEHIISGTYLLPEVVIYVKRSDQSGGGGFSLYKFGDDVGQLMNAGGVVWGAAEMGGQYLRQNNGAQVIGRSLGFGTQQTARALSGTVKTLGAWGKNLGTAGMVLSSVNYVAQGLDPSQTISTATHVNFWLSAGLYGAAAVIGGPIIGGAALIYGAGQLGSYMFTGNILEENILGK